VLHTLQILYAVSRPTHPKNWGVGFLMPPLDAVQSIRAPSTHAAHGLARRPWMAHPVRGTGETGET